MRATKSHARERILEAAYDLFSRHSVHTVGIDAIVARSGVARMTLYRHFASKEDLVIAFLQRRYERWALQWLIPEVERRAAQPRDRLMAIFDAFDRWFQQPDFEGCTFIRVLLESSPEDERVRLASAQYLAKIRSIVADFAERAGVREPEELAEQWQILMRGSIIAASEGDQLAARRAKKIAEVLLDAATDRVQSAGRQATRTRR